MNELWHLAILKRVENIDTIGKKMSRFLQVLPLSTVVQASHLVCNYFNCLLRFDAVFNNVSVICIIVTDYLSMIPG